MIQLRLLSNPEAYGSLHAPHKSYATARNAELAVEITVSRWNSINPHREGRVYAIPTPNPDGRFVPIVICQGDGRHQLCADLAMAGFKAFA